MSTPPDITPPHQENPHRAGQHGHQDRHGERDAQAGSPRGEGAPARIEEYRAVPGDRSIDRRRVDVGQVVLGVVAVLVAGVVAGRALLGADRVGQDLTAAHWMFAIGAVFVVGGLLGTLARRRRG